ncbi:MAG: hypothetical protein ACI9Y1_002506 [Lentisphaeria bacterium]|jgi:hypothetical protein
MVNKAFFLIIIFVLSLAGCSERDEQVGLKASSLQLDVYKSASCGCCGSWVEHIEQSGVQVSAINSTRLGELKEEKGIAPQYQSCHTAVGPQSYVFEGHIPAKFIHKFLANPPVNGIGLAVPGMPIGSPGMEMGETFSPYQVYLLKSDGSSEMFAQVNTAEEQYP